VLDNILQVLNPYYGHTKCYNSIQETVTAFCAQVLVNPPLAGLYGVR